VRGYLIVHQEAPKHPYRARIAGIVLIAAGGALLTMFVKSPVGTLAAWGFPQAWKGGPLLLGASFTAIIGFFLLIQRRFSLAAFMVSGILSAALTSGALAYVRSIRETVTVDSELRLPEADIQKFIAASRTFVTPEYLSAIARDAFAKGWLPDGIDFDAVMVTFGADARNKFKVTVTLTFEFSPYVQTEVTGARVLVRQYSDMVHDCIAKKVSGDQVVNYNEAGYLHDTLVDAQQKLILKKTAAANATEYNDVRVKAELDAARWLRDREPNADVRKVLEKMLNDVETAYKK
jgi:hypothetical protein